MAERFSAWFVDLLPLDAQLEGGISLGRDEIFFVTMADGVHRDVHLSFGEQNCVLVRSSVDIPAPWMNELFSTIASW